MELEDPSVYRVKCSSRIEGLVWFGLAWFGGFGFGFVAVFTKAERGSEERVGEMARSRARAK